MDIDKPLYYYTTVDTLDKILTSGAIRARTASYMNDADEEKFGLQALSKHMPEFAPGLKDGAKKRQELCNEESDSFRWRESGFHLICFTENDPRESTSLTQWVMYARENGIALEMGNLPRQGKGLQHRDSFWVEAEEPSSFPQWNAGPDAAANVEMAALGEIEFRQVKYLSDDVVTDTELSCADREALDGDLYVPQGAAPDASDAGIDVNKYALTIKHASFAQEQEWRLIIKPPSDHPHCVRIWSHAGLLDPFMDVRYLRSPQQPDAQSTASPNAKTTHFGWPITAVVVGPGGQQDRVFASLRSYLNRTYLAIQPLSYEEWEHNIRRCWLEWGELSTYDTPLVPWQEELLDGIRSDLLRLEDVSPTSPASDALDSIRSRITTAVSINLTSQKRADCLAKCDITRHGVLLQKSTLSYVY